MSEVTWELIWFCERVYKDDNISRTKGLRRAVKEYGACLKCVKKAAHLPQPRHAPRCAWWAIITDWREAQPLTEVLWTGDIASTPPFVPPMWMVILCQSEAQFHRASNLARTFKDQVNAIIPVLCESIPVKLLGGLIWKYFSNFQSTPAKIKEKQQRMQLEENYGECMKPLPTEESTNDVSDCKDRASLAGNVTAHVGICERPRKISLQDTQFSVHEAGASSGLQAILLHHGIPQQPLGALSPAMSLADDVDEHA